MDTSIIDKTLAFINEQRTALIAQREQIFDQQHDLQRQLDQVNDMLRKFDAFEGKPTPVARRSASSAQPRVRRGSKRDELLTIIRQGDGLTRGDILEKMHLKGDRAGEMSVSNALTGLTKGGHIKRQEGKYIST